MKNLLLLMLMFANSEGEKFLEEIALYRNDSYFKTKVYAEHDWKTFYELKEAKTVVSPDNYDLHLLNATVFFSTNKLRDKKGLKQLLFSSLLRDAAVVHSYQMVSKKFFSHYNGKTPKLRSPDDRMKLFGADNKTSGENIDMTYVLVSDSTTYTQLADKIVDNWLRSPPHKKNMLDKTFTILGCAAYFEEKDKQGARYVKATQDFGS